MNSYRKFDPKAHKMKVVVIGSGVGGMASAIRLAHLGHKVEVFEKNSFVGGKVNSLEKGGYRFDMGPSVFTEPHLVDELLNLAKTKIDFPYEPLEESFRYFFNDGQTLKMPAGTNGTIKVFTEELGEDLSNTKRYLKAIEKNYKALYPVFISSSLHRFKHWIKPFLFKALQRIPSYGLLTNMHKFGKRYFKNPKTIQIVDRYATYNGSSPYKTPGLLSIIAHLELNMGIYLPKGGMVSIGKSLCAAAQSLGVQFNFEQGVQEIKYGEGKVMGVVTEKGFVECDLVVSNMDVHYTYEKLLKSLPFPKKILSQELSSSAVVFYWGIKKSFAELGLHNIFFSDQYEQEFTAIFEDKTLVSDPSIYLNITSKIETNDAPVNSENWFVMVNAPINVGQDWEQWVKELRRHVLFKLSKALNVDIEPLIEIEMINEPVSLENKYFSKGGSIYGNSSNSKMAAFYRHPNFAPALKGLYFAGVTVHPGGGIPLALNAAKIVETLVKEDYPNSFSE